MAGEVLQLRGVGVRRGGATLLRDVTWTVNEGDRWVIVGPNGAGKTTLLQVAAAMLHPTEGSVEILEEELGRTDVFELRPRIGLASSSVAEKVPAGETVIDLVLTASYAILGRWQEEYDSTDLDRAVALLEALGAADLWSYLETRDAARAAVLALQVQGGSHVFHVAAPDTLAPYPTLDLLRRYHPSTAIRADLPGRTTPLDLGPARELLGFTAERTV